MVQHTPVMAWRQCTRCVSSCTKQDLAGRLLPESVQFAISGFLSLPVEERFAVFVEEHQGIADAPVVQGVLLLQVRVIPGADRIPAVIHALGVRDCAQDKGIGSCLLMRAVEFVLAQVIGVCSTGGCPGFAGTSAVEFHLARGSCLRDWSMLHLLCNHGWRIQQQGLPPMCPEDVRMHRLTNIPAERTCVSVSGPVIPLDAPFLYPGVKSGSKFFMKPNSLDPPPPPDALLMWKRSYKINRGIAKGAHPLSPVTNVFAMSNTGLLPFSVPLQHCQMMEN